MELTEVKSFKFYSLFNYGFVILSAETEEFFAFHMKLSWFEDECDFLTWFVNFNKVHIFATRRRVLVRLYRSFQILLRQLTDLSYVTLTQLQRSLTHSCGLSLHRHRHTCSMLCLMRTFGSYDINNSVFKFRLVTKR